MVRLEVMPILFTQCQIPNFNSFMVRLEVQSLRNTSLFGLFQFLYGTIRRSLAAITGGMALLFQFLYGTIRRYENIINQKPNINFNSFMVRLEETGQIQYFLNRFYFNSFMVRLEVYLVIIL